MDWQTLVGAFALMLIIEGILPFVNPDAMRRLLMSLARTDDQSLRFGGLTAIVIGYLLWMLVR